MMEPNPPHIPTPVPRPDPPQSSQNNFPYSTPRTDYIPPKPQPSSGLNAHIYHPSASPSPSPQASAPAPASPQPVSQQPTANPSFASPPAARQGDSAVNDAGRNLDKIRELIFGEEKKYFESRINQLETSLTQEINQLKALFDEHFKSLDRATVILAEQTRDRLESLTAQTQQERVRIGEQIREQHNTLYDMLAKATNDLRAEKVDRRVIAEMFAEMSKRILNHSGSFNNTPPSLR